MSYVETPTKTFQAGAAIAKYLRVTLSSGKLAAAGSTVTEIGTIEQASLADLQYVPVRLRTAQGTCNMIASEAITKDDPCYAAAGGKVSATGTILIGYALIASTADGDIVEVLRTREDSDASTATGTNAASFEVDADATTPKIKLQGQSGGTGDYTTTLKPESTLSADNTIIVPEADGDTLAAVALAQTLSNKTIAGAILTGNVKLGQTVSPVAAAGTTVADAAALPATTLAHITSDGAGKGVKFAAVTAATFKIVINNSATAAELYANDGGTVNGLSADASVVIPASKGVLAVSTGADTWIVFDLPAKATAS